MSAQILRTRSQSRAENELQATAFRRRAKPMYEKQIAVRRDYFNNYTIFNDDNTYLYIMFKLTKTRKSKTRYLQGTVVCNRG